MTCPRQEREKLEKILVGDFGVRAADSRGRRRAVHRPARPAEHAVHRPPDARAAV